MAFSEGLRVHQGYQYGKLSMVGPEVSPYDPMTEVVAELYWDTTEVQPYLPDDSHIRRRWIKEVAHHPWYPKFRTLHCAACMSSSSARLTFAGGTLAT